MSVNLEMTLEQEKDALFSDFKNENPELFEEYKNLVRCSTFEAYPIVEIFTREEC